LTFTRFRLFRQLLELKKAKIIGNFWTMDGRLFALANGSRVLVRGTEHIERLRNTHAG
jgi:hypothetical protein